MIGAAVVHVLLVTPRAELAPALRQVAGERAVFLTESDLEEALELIGRSARLDAVVADDPEVERAIRAEIPGSLPVYVAREGEAAAAIWDGLRALLDV